MCLTKALEFWRKTSKVLLLTSVNWILKKSMEGWQKQKCFWVRLYLKSHRFKVRLGMFFMMSLLLLKNTTCWTSNYHCNISYPNDILTLGDTSWCAIYWCCTIFFSHMAVWKEKIFAPQHFHSGNIIGIIAPSSQ